MAFRFSGPGRLPTPVYRSPGKPRSPEAFSLVENLFPELPGGQGVEMTISPPLVRTRENGVEARSSPIRGLIGFWDGMTAEHQAGHPPVVDLPLGPGVEAQSSPITADETAGEVAKDQRVTQPPILDLTTMAGRSGVVGAETGFLGTGPVPQDSTQSSQTQEQQPTDGPWTAVGKGRRARRPRGAVAPSPKAGELRPGVSFATIAGGARPAVPPAVTMPAAHRSQRLSYKTVPGSSVRDYIAAVNGDVKSRAVVSAGRLDNEYTHEIGRAHV